MKQFIKIEQISEDVDVRLYLYDEWCNNSDYFKEAGIPNENRAFKTKLEFAAEIIHQQISNGISFDFIGEDGYYGNDASLARAFDQIGYIYILDIHSGQKIFINCPELYLPEPKSVKGSPPKGFKQQPRI